MLSSDDYPIFRAAFPLEEGAYLSVIRRTGFYAVKNPIDGPAAGEFHILNINGRTGERRRSLQIAWNASTGAEHYRVNFGSGFGGWQLRSGGGGGSGNASGVAYDNINSGLAASSVQDALDEIEARVDNVEDDLSSLTTLVGTISTSLAGKADITYVDNLIAGLETRIDDLEAGVDVNWNVTNW